jgi:predicted Holliday junction resolvase-like endonuclease
MKISELKAELEMKKMELEMALKERKPHETLVQLYRQLKELQYNVIQEEIERTKQKDLDLV